MELFERAIVAGNRVSQPNGTSLQPTSIQYLFRPATLSRTPRKWTTLADHAKALTVRAPNQPHLW